MENKETMGLPTKVESYDEVPPLIEFIIANQVDGFDDNHSESTFSPNFVSSSVGNRTDEVQNHLFQLQGMHAVSISMPPSPLQYYLPNTKEILYSGDCPAFLKNDVDYSTAESKKASVKQVKFHSQPLKIGTGFPIAVGGGAAQNSADGRYNSFKTWSGKRQQLSESESNVPQSAQVKNLYVDRYFDALEGPELDTLRVSNKLDGS